MGFETQAIRSIKEFKEISLKKMQIILFLLLTFLFFVKNFDYNFFLDIKEQFIELMAQQYLKRILLVFIMIMNFLAYVVVLGGVITVFLLVIYQFYWDKLTGCYKLNAERWYVTKYIIELNLNLSTCYLLILGYSNVWGVKIQYTNLIITAEYFALFLVILFSFNILRFLFAYTDDE